MKLIPIAEAQNRVPEIAEALTGGGLACFPVRGSYRIAADASSVDAITRLMQSKRRARNHPTLILVGDLAAARSFVEGTAWKLTKQLAAHLWPGSLTLVLPPSEDLEPKIKKLLTRATGKLGVRVTDDPLAAAVMRRFGKPLLLSSANLEQKPGASSAAAVRQRFVNAVDVWVDAGDIKPTPPSTIVELTETTWKMIRPGVVALADVERALAA